MLEKLELHRLQKHKKQQGSPFKKRIAIQKKGKFMNPEPISQDINISISNFNLKSQLKAKIIKAILTNNQTIQREIEYRKTFSSSFTPKHNPKLRKNYKLNLSFQSKSKNNSDTKKTEIKVNSDSMRYNGTLEMMKIMKKQKQHNKDIKIQECDLMQHSFSKPQHQQTLLKTRARSYTNQSLRKTPKQQVQLIKKDKQYTDIKPWIAQSLHQRQFQYF